MRVLHLTSSLELGSGVMNVIMNYGKELKSSGVFFDFIYFNESVDNFESEIINNGGNIYKINKPTLGKNYKEYLTKQIESILLINRYNILHIHDVYLTFLFAPIVKKLGVKNVIAHSHATSYSDKMISSLRNRVLCSGINKHATAFIGCSLAAGKFYFKKQFKNNNVLILRNAIYPEKYSFSGVGRKKIREKHHIQDNEILIGNIGRLSAQKNQKWLIKMFDKLVDGHQNVKLMIIGSGPLESKIKEQISKRRLEKRIIMVKNTSEIKSYLSAFDLFMMPSIFEGLPLVGVEAQANGLYSIFSDKITKEIVFERGQLLPLSNAKKWIESVTNIKLNYGREIGMEIIKNEQYDIREQSETLKKYYLEMGF